MKPGESTTVTVSFTMHEGMDGPHHFVIPLKTNDKMEPEQTVAAKADFVK